MAVFTKINTTRQSWCMFLSRWNKINLSKFDIGLGVPAIYFPFQIWRWMTSYIQGEYLPFTVKISSALLEKKVKSKSKIITTAKERSSCCGLSNGTWLKTDKTDFSLVKKKKEKKKKRKEKLYCICKKRNYSRK